MSTRTKKQVNAAMRKLRREVIDSDDLIASRIAYAMECAVRWVTEDTDWGNSPLVGFATQNATTLEIELGRHCSADAGEGGG